MNKFNVNNTNKRMKLTSRRLGTAMRASRTFCKYPVYKRKRETCQMKMFRNWEMWNTRNNFIVWTEPQVISWLQTYHIEWQKFLQDTVPQLKIINLILQTKICHKMHSLKKRPNTTHENLYCKLISSYNNDWTYEKDLGSSLMRQLQAVTNVFGLFWNFITYDLFTDPICYV